MIHYVLSLLLVASPCTEAHELKVGEPAPCSATLVPSDQLLEELRRFNELRLENIDALEAVEVAEARADRCSRERTAEAEEARSILTATEESLRACEATAVPPARTDWGLVIGASGAALALGVVLGVFISRL